MYFEGNFLSFIGFSMENEAFFKRKILSVHMKRYNGVFKCKRFCYEVMPGLPDHCIFEAKSSTMLFVFVCTCLLFSLFT